MQYASNVSEKQYFHFIVHQVDPWLSPIDSVLEETSLRNMEQNSITCLDLGSIRFFRCRNLISLHLKLTT